MSISQGIEHFVERAMYASRWIMAPLYLGMSAILLALGIKFFQELWHFIPHILDMPDGEVIFFDEI